jgi:hypothetical protein
MDPRKRIEQLTEYLPDAWRMFMKTINLGLAFMLIFLMAACGGGPQTNQISAPSATDSSVDVSFAKDVLPIFNQNCVRCHGGRGGLFLDSYDNVMQGGVSGVVVIASDADGSLLIKRITAVIEPRMPMGGSLPQSDIDLIRTWIGDGALDN